jgi:predicted ATPase
LEGLPLGLELAATWVRVLSCAEIGQEIERNLDFLSTPARNMPERHRSLRAVFEHSWKLLSGEEQRALRQLFLIK